VRSVYIESMTGFRVKKVLSLDKFEDTCRKVKLKTHKLKGKLKCIALKVKWYDKSIYIHSV